MTNFFNKSIKAALIPLIPYWTFILLLIGCYFSFSEGRWAFIPLYFITYFPFEFLFEMSLAWFRQQDISISTTSSEIFGLTIIGGIINSLMIFFFVYVSMFLFNKNKKLR